MKNKGKRAFEDKEICLESTIPHPLRNKLQKAITENGGIVKAFVSSKVFIIVVM